jgi:hypothetical protein
MPGEQKTLLPSATPKNFAYSEHTKRFLLLEVGFLKLSDQVCAVYTAVFLRSLPRADGAPRILPAAFWRISVARRFSNCLPEDCTLSNAPNIWWCRRVSYDDRRYTPTPNVSRIVLRLLMYRSLNRIRLVQRMEECNEKGPCECDTVKDRS